MTRINTIDPKLLPTPWLVAEYRELPRILTRIASGKPFADIPDTYRMGAGHVKFFGDKAAFLAYRHFAIVAELRARNPMGVYTIDVAPVFAKIQAEQPELCKYWAPDVKDHTVCLGRLAERWKGSWVEWQHWLAAVVAHHQLGEHIYRLLSCPPKLTSMLYTHKVSGTGRMAASSLPLQQIAKTTEEATRIRDAFRAKHPGLLDTFNKSTDKDS